MQPTGVTTGAGSALVSAPALLELAEGSRWRTPEVTAVLAEHAVQVARDGGDEPTALLAEGWLAQALATVGRGVAAVPRAVDALSEAVRTDYLPASDRLRVALAGVARSLDDRGTALLLLDPVLSRADLVPKLRADAYLEAALCRGEQAGAEGEPSAEIALAALREIGGEYADLGEAAVHATLAGQLRALRHLAVAVRHAQAGLRQVLGERPETAAPQPVSAYLGATLGLELTLALLDQGQLDEAWEVARTVLSWDVHPGSLVPVARLRLAMAQRVHLPSGAREEALAAAHWVAAAVDRRDLPELEVNCYGLLAELREERGELAEALAARRRAHAAYRTLASTVERALVLLVRSAEEGAATVRQRAGERREARLGTGGMPAMSPGRAAASTEGSDGGPPSWMTGGGRTWPSSTQPARPPSTQSGRRPGAIEPGRTGAEPTSVGGQIPGRPGQNVFPLFEGGEPAQLGGWGSPNAGASWPRHSEGEARPPIGWSGPPETSCAGAPVGHAAQRSEAGRGGQDYPARVDLETTDPLLGRALGAHPFDAGPARTETTVPDVLRARRADDGGERGLANAPAHLRASPAGSPSWWSAGLADLGPSERAGSRAGFGARGLPRPADWPGPDSPGEIGLLLGASSIGTQRGGDVQPPVPTPGDRPTSAQEPFSSGGPPAAGRGGPWLPRDANTLTELVTGVAPPEPISGGDLPAGADRSIRPDPLTGSARSIRREPLSANAPSARTDPEPSHDLSHDRLPPSGSSGLGSWSAVAGSDPLGRQRPAPRAPLTGDPALPHDPLGSDLSYDIEPPTMFEALGGPDILARFDEHPDMGHTVGRGPLSGVDATAGLEPTVASGQQSQLGTFVDAGQRDQGQPDEIERHAELSLAQLAIELLGLSGPGAPLPLLIVINVVPPEGPIGGPAVSAVVRRVAAWVAGQLPPWARSFPLDRGAVAVGVPEAEPSTVSTWATTLSSRLSARGSELAAEIPGVRFHVGLHQLDENRTVIEQLWDLHLGEDVPDPDQGGWPPPPVDSGGQELSGGGRHMVGAAEVDSGGWAGGHRINAQPGSGGRRRRRDAGSGEPGVTGRRSGSGSEATGSAATDSAGSWSGQSGGGVGAGSGGLGWVGSSGLWSDAGSPGLAGRGLNASGDAGAGKASRGEGAPGALGLLLGVPGDAGPRGAGGVEAGEAGVDRSGGVAVGVRRSDPIDRGANRGRGGPKGRPALRAVLDEPGRRHRQTTDADRGGGISSWNLDWTATSFMSARATFLDEPARERAAADGQTAHGGLGVSRGLKLLLGDPERAAIAPRTGRGVGLLPAPAVALRHSPLIGDDKSEACAEGRPETAEVSSHAAIGSALSGLDGDIAAHGAPGTSGQRAASGSTAADRPSRHQASAPAPQRAIVHGAAGRLGTRQTANEDPLSPPRDVQPVIHTDPLASAGGVPQPMTDVPDPGTARSSTSPNGPDLTAAEIMSGAAEPATSGDGAAEPPTSSGAEAAGDAAACAGATGPEPGVSGASDGDHHPQSAHASGHGGGSSRDASTRPAVAMHVPARTRCAELGAAGAAHSGSGCWSATGAGRAGAGEARDDLPGGGGDSGTDDESAASGAADELARGVKGPAAELGPGATASVGPATAQPGPPADEPTARENGSGSDHPAATRAIESAEADDLLRRPVSELSFAELIAGALVAYRQA